METAGFRLMVAIVVSSLTLGLIGTGDWVPNCGMDNGLCSAPDERTGTSTIIGGSDFTTAISGLAEEEDDEEVEESQDDEEPEDVVDDESESPGMDSREVFGGVFFASGFAAGS